ncbi:hypothetical protein AB1A64_10545 [Ruegeria sp. ANG10]|uniref:hypothetical protein n=1 Tax=Ruegeria sp. ANG10 TaxID=3042467 RepID=UPI00345328B0
MFTFQTPRLPKPLELDLADLNGGGSCPSQFYGHTHDDRKVYVRYRGGLLSVRIGAGSDEDAVQAEPLLEVDIGPTYDGSITLTQFCRLFGVTVCGEIPPEANPESDLNTDLSGQTTYLRAYLDPVTPQTADTILNIAKDSFPDALLVQPVVNENFKLYAWAQAVLDGSSDSFWLVDGITDTSQIKSTPERFILPVDDQLQIALGYTPWKWPGPRYSGMALERAHQELGRPFFQPGIRGVPLEHELTIDSFQISTAFPTADAGTRERLSALGERLKPVLPSTELVQVNLTTDQVIAKMTRRLDPVVNEWCRSAPNRWLSIRKEGRDGDWTGVRPA